MVWGGVRGWGGVAKPGGGLLAVGIGVGDVVVMLAKGSSETALAGFGDGVGNFGDGVVGDGVGDVGDVVVGDGFGEVGVGSLAGTFR
jgi:hypothetical protein